MEGKASAENAHNHTRTHTHAHTYAHTWFPSSEKATMGRERSDTTRSTAECIGSAGARVLPPPPAAAAVVALTAAVVVVVVVVVVTVWSTAKRSK